MTRKIQSECTDCLVKIFSANLDCTYIALGATVQMPIRTHKLRGIFRTQSNICDVKKVNCELFFVKNSIVDVQVGSKYISET